MLLGRFVQIGRYIMTDDKHMFLCLNLIDVDLITKVSYQS